MTHTYALGHPGFLYVEEKEWQTQEPYYLT
jgi:hypothetical protein